MGWLDQYKKGGMIKRADGSYSQRGLWDNIRANAGSGKKPTKEMLKQEKKIRAAEKKEYGGWLNEYQAGGIIVDKSPESIKKSVYEKYPILNKAIPIDSAFVSYPQGKDIEVMKQWGHNPEYVNPDDSYGWINKSGFKVPAGKVANGPDGDNLYPSMINVPHIGYYNTIVDTTGKNRQDIENIVANDFLSHGLHNLPEYNKQSAKLKKELVKKYGKHVEEEGGVDAYVRSLIDPKNYPTYQQEMPVDTSYTNPIKRLIGIKQSGGKISTTGYKADSPDRNNLYNIIPSGRISMDNVPHPVKAIDNYGNAQYMVPGGEYQFQGDRVLEVPAMKEGGIPQRYKNMGFTHVGQKKAGDGQHKWKVLAKKGDSYKVVQGGYRGMQDFKQHHSQERRDRFWDRMGGRDSAKAKDPFSPLYWHKRFGTWEYGGWLNKYQDGGDVSDQSTLEKVANVIGDKLGNFGVSAWRSMGNFIADKMPDTYTQQERENIFNTYRPVKYPGYLGAAKEYVKGVFGQSDLPLKDPEGDYNIGEEAWRKALDLPTKEKYITESKYKPTNAKDPNAKYYTLNDVIDQEKLIQAAKRKGMSPGAVYQMEALTPYIKKEFMDRVKFIDTDPLQKFQLSVDPKGKYVSIYDKYDFDFAPANKVIKPYEFYDRFYLPKEKKKIKEYGGWLKKYK